MRLLALLATACQAVPGAQSESSVDSSADAAVGADVALCDLQDISGRTFRITALVIEQPAGPQGALAQTLNSLWADEIRTDDLAALLRVDTWDAATGTAKAEVGTGIRVAGATPPQYQMLANPGAEQATLVLDGCAFDTPDRWSLEILPERSTHPVIVSGVRATGRLDAAGLTILDGRLQGGLCPADLQAVDFKMAAGVAGCTNMAALLNDLGMQPDTPDVPCSGGPAAGYAFASSFQAASVDAVPGASGSAPAVDCNQ